MIIDEKFKELNRILKKHKNIFITGHRNLDLDAIGSCIGISLICKKLKKNSYIIIDDEKHELGVNKILNEIDKKLLIKSSDIDRFKGTDDLLVIVDTNKKSLLQNEELINTFNDSIIIDHHETNEKTIKSSFKVIDSSSSSSCEMITDLIKKYKINLSSTEATIILSGIVLDTNNFVVKVTSNTYKSAYYLSTFGADSTKVQYYLKQDINDYILRQDLIRNVIIKNNVAITLGNENINYRREELAKMADTLLQFNGINASYVLGKIDSNIVGLSARSDNEIDVSKIAEKLGGGGDKNDAAAQISNVNINDVFNKLKEFINGDE